MFIFQMNCIYVPYTRQECPIINYDEQKTLMFNFLNNCFTERATCPALIGDAFIELINVRCEYKVR